MIGRTIVGVRRPDSYGEPSRYEAFLVLDDGTEIELRAHGYEVDELTIDHLTPERVAERHAEEEQERREHEADLERIRIAAEKREAHIEEMRGKLKGKEFEKWRRETYPTTREVFGDVYSDLAKVMTRQMYTYSPLLDGLDGRQATVPLVKKKARRS